LLASRAKLLFAIPVADNKQVPKVLHLPAWGFNPLGVCQNLEHKKSNHHSDWVAIFPEHHNSVLGADNNFQYWPGGKLNFGTVIREP